MFFLNLAFLITLVSKVFKVKYNITDFKADFYADSSIITIYFLVELNKYSKI